VIIKSLNHIARSNGPAWGVFPCLSEPVCVQCDGVLVCMRLLKYRRPTLSLPTKDAVYTIQDLSLVLLLQMSHGGRVWVYLCCFVGALCTLRANFSILNSEWVRIYTCESLRQRCIVSRRNSDDTR
jgi:hypothetical protein